MFTLMGPHVRYFSDGNPTLKNKSWPPIIPKQPERCLVLCTVYSLFADTPHKRTSPLNGHFLRDRQNMYGFANKIFPLKRTPY
jgi:hypothetical protein